MAMPEARREQILSERAEERERDAFNRQLRLRHENQQKENAKSADKKKRKATTADLDEPQRKVSKQKVKQNELLEGYKKQREQRNEQRQKDGDRRAHGPKSSSQDERGSGASGVESDVDWDEDHQRSGAPKDDPEPTLRQFERTRIGRTRFAQCCFIPGFEEAIKGCFVRVNIGPDPVTKELVYRMTRITGTFANVQCIAIDLLTLRRIQSGQALPSGKLTRQDLLHRPVRCVRHGQIRKGVGFHLHI